MDEIVVLVTTSGHEEATRVAKRLVDGGLVACANIIPQIRSLFWWEGAVADEEESLILLKTQSSRFQELERKIKEIHSYDVPEIIALPIVHGSSDYLSWVREMTDSRRTK